MAKKPAIAPVNTLAYFVADFWRVIEEKCLDKDGVKILDREHYGLRESDKITILVKGSLKTTTVGAFWLNVCTAAGINADLMLTSRQAVNLGILKSGNLMGKDPKNPGEKRSYGVQFWTPANTVYQKNRSKKSTTAAITGADLMEAIGLVAPL